MRIAPSIELTEREVNTLRGWSRGGRTATRLTKRAKIVLMAAGGEQDKTIAELLGVDRHQVSRWRRRFIQKRLAGIEKDLPRGGRKPKKREHMAALIIKTTPKASPLTPHTGAFGRWPIRWGSTSRWCTGCGKPAV
jgi:transposase-like protein